MQVFAISYIWSGGIQIWIYVNILFHRTLDEIITVAFQKIFFIYRYTFSIYGSYQAWLRR